MMKAKSFQVVLSAAALLGVSAVWAQEGPSIWIGGTAKVTSISTFRDDAANWDGLPPTEANKVDVCFTNSVTIDVGYSGYWYPKSVTVKNNSTVYYKGRTRPTCASDGEFVWDIEEGSSYQEAYLIYGGSKMTFVKKGEGLFHGSYFFPHGSTPFKLIDVREGTVKVSDTKCSVHGIRVRSGATLQVVVAEAFKTVDGSDKPLNPILTVDEGGLVDFDGKSQTLAALEGEGEVRDAGPLRLTLAQSGYGFNGLITGGLKIQPMAERTAADAYCIISNQLTLARCTLTIEDVEECGSEVKFAEGVEAFYALSYPTDRTYYTTAGEKANVQTYAVHVDAANGKDDYTGLDVGCPNHPYKTLAAAMGHAWLLSGMHVRLAPGDYKEGEMKVSESDAYSSRVRVPKNVTLESKGSAADTFITGGDNIRCVHLGKDAVVKGVTLRDANVAASGGGVASSDDLCGYAWDCIITNCTANRGSGAYYTHLRNCQVLDCESTDVHIVNYGSAYNCIFGAQRDGLYICSYLDSVVNCTFLPSSVGLMAAYYFSEKDYKQQVRNCIICGKTQNGAIYDHCAFVTNSPNYVKVSDANLGTGSFRTAWEDLTMRADGQLRFLSPAIDAGDETLYPSAAGTTDLFGAMRVMGTTIDLGAAEFDPTIARIEITDAQGSLTLEGASVGETHVTGDPITLKISRNFAAEKFALGFWVNGEYIDFNAHEDDWVWTKTVATAADSVKVSAVYAEKMDWYVDAKNGKDTNDGLRPSAAHARQSLTAMLSDVRVKSGDTVWALPGEYTNNYQYAGTSVAESNTRNRAIVPAGVTLRSTEGAAKTIIRGAKAKPEDYIYIDGKLSGYSANWGIGTNCTRAVVLSKNSVVRGFTIADGVAWSDCKGSKTYTTGGNVSAPMTAYIVDCIITNGCAERGGGGSGGNYVRCRFTGNIGASIGASLFNRNNLYGCLVEKGRSAYAWYNANSPKSIVLNTTFTADNYDSTGSVRDRGINAVCFINSVDQRGAYDTGCYYNSLTKHVQTNTIYDAQTDVTTDAATALDENRAPIKGLLACDTGDLNHFLTNWPAAYRAEMETDLLGNPRIQNGAIDRGAVERDWRADYATDLKLKRIEVTAMSTNVYETAEGNVALPNGGAVTLAWKSTVTRALARTFSFTVTDGTLTVKVNGTTVGTFTEDGTWTYESPSTSDLVEFSYTGTATAELLTTKGAAGFLINIR